MAYCSFFLFIVLRKLIVHFTIVGDTWPLSASTCYPFSFSSWASPAPPCSAACLGFKLDMLKPTEDYSSQQPLHLDETMWPRQGNVWKRRLARACSPEGRGLLSSALSFLPRCWLGWGSSPPAIQDERGGHILSSWGHRQKGPLSVWRLMRQVSTKE